MKDWITNRYSGLICLITPRCATMARLISSERESPHSLIMRLRMHWHYGICVWCRRYHDQVGLIGNLSRMFAEESSRHGENQLTDDARNRLKAALRLKTDD